MKWIRDNTGRFVLRPYYEPREIDAACERTIINFLIEKYGRVLFPLSTDDLTIMLERGAGDLDLYADLTALDVEGVTEFSSRAAPKVKIARQLSEPHMENRQRTTITHEFTHVEFHHWLIGLLRIKNRSGHSDSQILCKRESILEAGKCDWMEWQAGYGCGAYLMPITYLAALVKKFCATYRVQQLPFATDSSLGIALTGEVTKMFQVSQQAAQVRLRQHNVFINRRTQSSAFVA